MKERITDLEIRLTHQERTIEELNETVCRQDQALALLTREVTQLREQMKIILPSLIKETEEDEPPPHY